jgi:hypothetical protein
MALVALYQYWEDHYRERIAKHLGKAEKGDLKEPVMGDMGHLRNCIIHHRGTAKKEARKCEVLQWFDPGQKILMDAQKMEELVNHLREMLERLKGKDT